MLLMDDVVKRLAKETGMVVIASIHQPNFEVFELFDGLLLLAEGKTMYNGRTGEFFARHPPSSALCRSSSHSILDLFSSRRLFILLEKPHTHD